LGLLPWALANDTGIGEFQVQKGRFHKYLTFTGELHAAQSVSIATPNISSSWTFTISYLAPEGAKVGPGDLLAEFDTSSLQSKRLELEKKREEARIKIAQKEAEIEGRRQDILLEQATAQKVLKVAELYARIDLELITRADAEKYQFDLSKAKLDLDKVNERLANLEKSARAELEVVRLDYEQADLELRRLLSELERMTVRATMPGLVLYAESWQNSRKLQKGDTVFKGQQIIQLPNMDEVRVLAYVYDMDFARLHEGMTAEVVLDALPGRTFPGKLAPLPEVASQKTFQSQLKVFRVDVLLLDKDLTIMKPGMTARVRVPLAERDALIVPRMALHLNPRGETYVMRRSSPPAPVPVNVLDANDTLVALEPKNALELKERQPVVLNMPGQTSKAKREIEWIPVKREDLILSISGSGMLAAEKAVEIRPPSLIDYRTFKIVRMVDEGTTVKEGDFLIEFDKSEIQKRLRDEEANYQKAQQEHTKTKSSLELNVKDLELKLEEARVQKQKADNKLVQAREFEGTLKVKEAEFEAALERQRVEMTEKKLASIRKSTALQLQLLKDAETFYQQRIQTNKAALEKLQIKAPISGVVIYQPNWNNEKKQVGSNAFMAETILSIPDLSTLLVQGQVSEVDAGKIKVGQTVTVTLDAIPEQTFTGKIVRTSSIFKQASFDRPVKVFEIEIKMDRIDMRRMRPGMATRLHVVAEKFKNVLALPLSVIHLENGKSFVWIKENGKPMRRQVTLGKNNGIVAIVESGLADGSQVSSRPVL
jgi:RND family efflux transporter MFP subunit